MRKLGVVCAVVGLVLAVGSEAMATTFATGVDPMNYVINPWSIRTGYTAGRWKDQTPEYFMFDTTWADRYKVTDPKYPVYSQALSGAAVVTDVFSLADLQAVATAGPGWASMSGPSSPISFWNHGGQFLKQSGGNNDSWSDDTYWASNEYGYVNPNPSTVVTEYTGTFEYGGCGYLEGKILADDWAAVFINTSLVYTTDSRAYDAVETFYFSGLNLGSNALRVLVYDTGQGSSPTAGPTALQLELDVIPEPLTLLGMFLGLGSVGAYIKRRRMK